MSDPGSDGGRRGKVVGLIEKRGLDDIGDRLEARWTAEGDDRMSLRDLADDFNRTLLRTAMEEAGMQPFDGDTENVYRLLTGDDVSGADQIRTERRLDREGVDVDRLQDEFVTYQAIRTYLTDHRGATYSGGSEDQVASKKEHIQRLQERLRTVTDSKLEQLQRNGDVELESFRTLIDVTVLCNECGTQYDVEALLGNGGCDCSETES